jgi:hypothetical protein
MRVQSSDIWKVPIVAGDNMASVSQKQRVGGDEDGQNGMTISGLARDFRG